MKVALFGATGFVGSYLVDALVAAGHRPSALVRPGSEGKLRHGEDCDVVKGEIGDLGAVTSTLAGCEAAIYCIGIMREIPAKGVTFQALQLDGARRAIDLARGEGVGRFLLMSANGVRPDGTDYQRTKYLADQHLLDSGLDGTVFRPSVMFGDPRGRMELATQLYLEVIRSPLPAPLFYEGLLPADAGGFALAPAYVGDVAQAFVASLERPETFGQAYPLCGPQALSWREILQIIARAGGRPNKLMMPAPAWGVKAAATAFDRFEAFPITRDQIAMLLEGNTCEGDALRETFGIDPLPFTTESLRYLEGG